MARHPFGGGLSDWAIVPDASGLAVLTGGAVITLWTLATGGSKYTDLTDSSSVAISSVTASDGTDGLAAGQIPQFYGPDGVWVMWAAINDPGDGTAPRQMMCSTDIGAAVAAQASTAAALQSSVASFSAQLGADSGIATLGEDGLLLPDQRPAFTLAGATDVDVDDAEDGDTLSYNGSTSKWEPKSQASLPGWANITGYAAGITMYQVQPAWRLMLPGTVQLVGRFTYSDGATKFSSGATLCTLPAGARPAQTKYVVSAANRIASHGDYARLTINTNGTVVADWADSGYAPGWIGVDGIIYDLGTS